MKLVQLHVVGPSKGQNHYSDKHIFSCRMILKNFGVIQSANYVKSVRQERIIKVVRKAGPFGYFVNSKVNIIFDFMLIEHLRKIKDRI